MTPDQLPAGLPMDDKIEAWRHGLLRLVLQHARAYADNSDPAKTEAAYVAICDYLRTTPEGYRLVLAEPVAWLVQYTTHGQPRSQVHQHNTVGDIRALFDPDATVTELYAAPMLAAAQESGN